MPDYGLTGKVFCCPIDGAHGSVSGNSGTRCLTKQTISVICPHHRKRDGEGRARLPRPLVSFAAVCFSAHRSGATGARRGTLAVTRPALVRHCASARGIGCQRAGACGSGRTISLPPVARRDQPRWMAMLLRARPAFHADPPRGRAGLDRRPTRPFATRCTTVPAAAFAGAAPVACFRAFRGGTPASPAGEGACPPGSAYQAQPISPAC